jgi:hypothetical protein
MEQAPVTPRLLALDAIVCAVDVAVWASFRWLAEE